MPWSELTPAQQTFLKKYVVKGGGEADANVATPGAGAAPAPGGGNGAGGGGGGSNGATPETEGPSQGAPAEATADGAPPAIEPPTLPAVSGTSLEQVVALLDQIPPDYPEKDILSTRAGEIQTKLDSEDPSGAEAEADSLLAEVEQTFQALQLAAHEIRAAASTPEVLQGATPEEQTEVDGKKQEILTAIGPGPDLPTKADRTRAQQLEAALTTRIEELRQLIEQRNELLQQIEGAWTPIQATVEELAGFDPVMFSSTSVYDQMLAAIQSAIDLQSTVQLAMASTSVLELEGALAAIEAWNTSGTDVPALVEAATTEVREQLNQQYGEIANWHEDLANADISSFPEEDQRIIAPLQADVITDMQAVRAAIATDQLLDMLTVLNDLGNIDARGDAMEAAVLAAEQKLNDAIMEGAGIGEAHRDRMNELYASDPDGYAQAQDILAETSGTLGNAEVTPEFLDEKKGDAEGKAQQADAAYAILKPAQDEMDEQVKLLEELMAKKEELQRRIEAAGDRVPRGLQEQMAEVDRDIGLKQAVITSLEGPLQTKQEAYDNAKSAADDAKELYEAASKQKLVLDALSYGPLAPDAGRPISAEARADLLAAIDENPNLGSQAMELVGSVEDPEAFAETALYATEKAADGFEADDGTAFASEAYAEKYAGNLIKMAASLPPEQGAEMEAYIKAGRHFESVPEMDEGATFKELAKNRTNYVSEASLKDGEVDLAGAKSAVQDVMFHPDSVLNGTPMLANQMLDTVEFLEGDEDARNKINGMTKPTTAGGQALVEKSTGDAAADQDDDDAKMAMLNGLMTPVFQGDIGSCFATSSIVRMRTNDPAMMVDTFKTMIDTGQYHPTTGSPVNVVQNTPDNEDPLVRSLEYSAATVAAREAGSREQNALAAAAGRGSDTLEDKVKDTEWANVKAKIDTAIATAFTFKYDPEAAIDGPSNDGKSKKGRYVLVRKDTQADVNDKAAFIDAVADKVLAEIDLADLEPPATKDTIRSMISADAFVEAMKNPTSNKYPWELSSGGWDDAAAKAIHGDAGVLTAYLPKATKPLDEGARTRDVLSGYLDQFGQDPSEVRLMGTTGQHSFNSTPNHPSLDPLKDGGPGKYAENLQREVYDKGAELKDTELSTEKAQYMFDKEMETLLDAAEGDAKTKLEAGIQAHRPTAPIKPADFDKAVKEATEEFREAKAQAALEAFKKEYKAEHSADAPADKCDEQLAEYRKALEKSIDDLVTNRLIKDMGAPEFVIADTNWGSNRRHTFFVIVPDPTTGEPKLMEREDPPGTLSYAGDDWLETSWERCD